jgi:hypothetical protein
LPKVAQLRAIKIYVYVGDHGPPHFHARHANRTEAVIKIGNLKIMVSDLSSKDEQRVIAWARSHQALLRRHWRKHNRIQ